jgi:enterochelin esterase-like enzyme
VSISQVPKVSSGIIKHYEKFESKYVVPRNVDVWLPDGYDSKKKYAVLYMHDGKGLYDSAIMWNKQEWGVDEVLGRLLKEGKVKNCIVVGAWNSEGTRHPEYFPQKPYESLSQIERDTITARLQKMGRTKEIFRPISDNYLKFLVEELKPFIDKNFSTNTDAKNTFMAGSSMGGLISMYAICEYPNVFGGAACLSTHWPGTFKVEGNPIPEAFFQYMIMKLPDPKKHKLYFDYGDQTLDALYPPLQKKADQVIKAKGYTAKNWLTKYFPGENHSEKAWSKRLDVPMFFLLKK